MNRIDIKAPAKLNLFLDITGKRENGYHEICSVMQTIDIFDYVRIEKSDEIRVTCSKSSLSGEKNIAHKAALLFFRKTGISSGAEIFIDKKIPTEAGMAGGSADAAAVLKGLNILFDEPLSEKELCSIGAECGADVPFSITGSTMLAEGIGEELSSLPGIPDCWLLIVKPEFGMSTVESYKYYDEHGFFSLGHPDSNRMLAAIENNSLSGICGALFNALEHTVTNPVIAEIREKLLGLGAMGSMMTGSGTAVFGIFDSAEKAVAAKNEFSGKFPFVSIARPFSAGASFDKSAAVYERLSGLGIPFERIDHPAVYTMEEMYSLGIFEKGIIGKNLFLRDNKGKRHFLVFVCGDKKVNLQSLETKIGMKHCSFASAERLERYLGLTKGSVSPFGVINDTSASVEFIIDRDFIGIPFIGAHPNQNTSTLWVGFDDLIRLIESNGNKIRYIDI